MGSGTNTVLLQEILERYSIWLVEPTLCFCKRHRARPAHKVHCSIDGRAGVSCCWCFIVMLAVADVCASRNACRSSGAGDT